MSAILCPECGGHNPSGSKFCNNCGSPLPPETHIVCPNCRQHNPLNLLYCDFCGSRLVEDDVAESPHTPDRELPAPPKAFNLPSRARGDTDDLAIPSLHPHAIPDWLKESDAIDMSPPSPPVAPTPPPTSPADTPAAPPADPALADFARWLEDLSEDTVAAPGDAQPSTPFPATDELNAWLDADDETVSPRDDLPDWLRAAAPRGTGILSTQPPPPRRDDARPADLDPAANIPDWLTEFAPPGTGILGKQAPQDEDELYAALAADVELPDWLRDLDVPPIIAESKIGAPPGQTPPPPPPPAQEKPTPPKPQPEESFDWLAELAADDITILPPEPDSAAAETPAWLAEMKPETQDLLPQEPPEAALPDWLADAEAPAEEAGEWASAAASQLEQMPAFTEDAGTLPDEQPTAADAELPDWLQAFAMPPAAAEAPTTAADDATFFVMDDDEDALLRENESPLPAEQGDWSSEDEEFDDTNLQQWLAELDALPADSPDTEVAAAKQRATGDLSDWLAELSEEDAEDEAFTDIPDWMSVAEAPSQAEGADEDAPLVLAPDAVDSDLPDWLDLFTAETETPAESATQGAGAMPDWLAEFADTDLEEEEAEAALFALEEGASLPDWLRQIPLAEQSESEDVPAESEPAPLEESWMVAEELPPSDTGRLADVPEELASAELPEWLQDSLSRSPARGGTSSLADLFAPAVEERPAADAELPTWLQPADAGDFDAALLAALTTSAEPGNLDLSAGDEWSDILGEMPPATPTDLELPPAREFAGMSADEDALAAAEIPAWLQPFKPRELRGAGETYEPEEPIQESGPLAGMRGVIDIEPIVAQPRETNGDLPQFTVSPAQRQQASLLRQITQNAPAPTVAASAAQPAALPTWSRLLLALLLLAALIGGALLPDLAGSLVGAAEPPLPAAAAALDTVQAAAGQPVLVAFDYTPAMSGELEPQARLLLRQLADNGSPVLTISQSAAGMTLAARAAAETEGLESVNLGYLPGEAVGLRLLGKCLTTTVVCQTTAGIPLTLSHNGEPVRLAILLTADRQSLVNWVEQVGAAGDTPLLAAVTQSLSPNAGPYYASGQLKGLIAGLPAAAAYENRLTGAAGPLTTRFRAQGLAYWLVIVLLIGGSLYYLATGLTRRSRH